MKKRSTLRDVAQLAGVSTATVARVLHNQGYVAATTRQRVESALAESDYRINVVAQVLRTQRTWTIGHLLHGVWPNPFFAGVALGVEQEAARHGFSVLMYNSRSDSDRERRGVEWFLERNVDAIIFTTAVGTANVRLAVEGQVPVVQVERVTAVETGTVMIDHHRGAYEAMSHLFELGHRRVAYIGGDPKYYAPTASGKRNVEQERLRGYLEAHERFGLELSDDLIFVGRYFSLEDSGIGDEGYRQMRRLMDRSEPPTAAFAACDLLAAGALQAVYELRLRVPQDVSIVGFDDTLAPHLAPPLTTVRLPMRAIGEAAVRLALESRAGGARLRSTRTLRPRLVVRGSTGPPAQ